MGITSFQNSVVLGQGCIAYSISVWLVLSIILSITSTWSYSAVAPNNVYLYDIVLLDAVCSK